MRRPFACLAALCLLSACSSTNWTPPAAPEIAPVRPDPVACLEAEARPAIPPGAAVMAPETEAERKALMALVAYVERLADWGGEGWARALAAQTQCETRQREHP